MNLMVFTCMVEYYFTSPNEGIVIKNNAKVQENLDKKKFWEKYNLFREIFWEY